MFTWLAGLFSAIRNLVNIGGWLVSRDLMKKGETQAQARQAKKGEEARRGMENTKRPSSDDVAKRLRNGRA